MTNKALQAMITEFGDRICMIVFDNNNKIYIGYQSSPLQKASELTLATKGDVDFVGVPVIPKDPKLVRLGVTGVAWHPTECIQAVFVIDEKHAEYRLDPFDYM